MKIIKDNYNIGEKKDNRVFIITLSLFVYTLLVTIACIVSSTFADWYNSTVGAFLRLVLSIITGFLPFSVAETGVILLPFAVIVLATNIVRNIVKKKQSKKLVFKKFLIVVFCTFTVFVNVFGIGYFTSGIEKNLGLEREPLTREEMYNDGVYTKDLLASASEKVEFDENGASVNPHSHAETDRLVDKGYDVLSKNGVYKSIMVGRTKKILLSELMTYTHISGIYMPFTGEANINTNYPDYVVAFSIAHEKAHQRGIADEDEANFMAFLSCMASGDDYLEYAALMSMYDYFLDAAFNLDIEMYEELVEITPKVVLREMYAYYKFFEKYSDSAASMLAENINDTYLKTLGNENGVKSYGLVIELYDAYIRKEQVTGE